MLRIFSIAFFERRATRSARPRLDDHHPTQSVFNSLLHAFCTVLVCVIPRLSFFAEVTSDVV